MARPRQAAPTLRGEARAALAACAGTASRLAARRISQFLDRRMATSGLGIAQFGLMAQIATAADDTMGALAERMGLDPSTLSRNLRVLEQEGLIEIALVEGDQRRRAVWLTETGLRRLEKALAAWRKAHGELAKIVPPGLIRRLSAASEALGDTNSP